MRLSLFLAVAALYVAVASHPIKSTPANFTSTFVDPKNSTYNPLPPSSQDPIPSPPAGSNWPLYHTGGLILLILSVSVGVWKRYRTDITVIFMSFYNSIRSPSANRHTRTANTTPPNPTSITAPQETEIPRPLPVIYNPSSLLVQHTGQVEMLPPRYTQRQNRPYAQSAGPSYRAPSRRTYPTGAFEEEDIEMDAFGPNGFA